MLLALLGLRAAFAGDVMLNEILYDPDSEGGDEGSEWIELCNRTGVDIDLTGWSIEAAGTSFSSIFTFPTLSIAPGEHLLIGAGSAYALSGTMQNGGSATDGVRLVDDLGAVMDTVLYDEPNDNGLQDDGGTVGTEFAPDVAEGNTLARMPDCTDSDDISLDWFESSSPTPGDVNELGSTTSGDADCSARDDIRLNEIMPDPDSEGGDDGYEWVELYNAGPADVDLTGWELVNRKSAASSKTIVVPDGTWIVAGGFLVLGEKEVGEADVIVDLDMGNDSSGVDSVELWCNDDYVDLFAYGGDNDLSLLNEDGLLSTVADRGATGWSLGRDPDGADTNDCAVDLVTFEYPSPGGSNADSGEGDCPGMDDVKINEFTPNPAKQEEAEEEDPEWLELYNAGTAAVSLDGWSIQYGTSPSSSKSVDLSGLVSIEPGEYLVVGEKGAENVDLVVEMDMGAASSNADRVQLRHCGPGVADTVVYGDPNDDEWTDESGEVATSLAEGPADGDTLQRVQDGYDTDECGVDWAISSLPTPGSANPEIICSAGQETIKVNELYPDPEGSDGDQEWVELYNAGDSSQALDGWILETATSSWGVDFVVPGGIELGPGEFLLIGNSDVPIADLTATSLGLGNAGTAPDGVRLVDCEGTVQDTVLYGPADAEVEDLELVDDQGFQDMAPMGDSGRSIGRVPDGVDSDDSSVDFDGNLAPTPGAANGVGSDDDDNDPTVTGGKGCGNKGTTDAKKCGVVGVAGGLEWLLIAFVAVRRRRG